jgi:WD40 repeat protein
MIRIEPLVLAVCLLSGGLLLAAPVPPGPGADPPNPVEPAAAANIEVCQPLLRFGEVRLRHPAPVASLALTADGSRLLTATRAEPVLRVWDVKSGRLLRAVRITAELTDSLTALALSPDGRTALVIRHGWRPRESERPVPEREPVAVDLATGSVTRWPLGRKFEDPHPAFALSPDGRTFAGLIDAEVRVWEFASGTERILGTIPDPKGLTGGICFSPDGTRVAACRGKSAFFIALIAGRDGFQRVRVKGDENVQAVYWPQPNRVVAVCSGQMAAFDPATGVQRDHAIAVWGLGHHFQPEEAGGRWLVFKASTSSPIQTFDLTTLLSVPERTYPSDRDERFAVAGNGTVLAIASGHAVRLFDPATGAPLHPDLERAPLEPLTRLYTAADTLLGATDTTAHAWTLSDGTLRAPIEGTAWQANRYVLSPDGRFAAAGASNRAPLVIDLRTGRGVPVRYDEKDWIAYRAIGFAGADRVWVWNQRLFHPVELATDRIGSAIPAYGSAQWAMASPDGRKLATSGSAGLALWELDRNREWTVLDSYKERQNPLHRLGKEHPGPPYGVPVRFSPCGRWLLVADAGLELWNIQNKPVLAGKFPTAGASMWGDGDFSPDGRFLAAAVTAPDGASELCVWETASEGEVYRFRPSRGVSGVAFSPDGRRLVIAHTDTTLSVWDRAGLEARRCGNVPVGAEWDWLGSRDAKRAHAAVAALVADPKRALAALAPALAPPDAATINRLFAELGGEEFRVRERAGRAITALGEYAEPALRAAISKSESPEVRARAAVLLGTLEQSGGRLAGERIRATRAVDVLERIATPEARALLAKCASAYPNSPLAAEVNSALARLAKK